jgi:hypothetical protein
MNLHRMRRIVARASLVLALATLLGFGSSRRAAADLIRPNATQAFPDIQGNIVGTQTYTYNSTTQTGTFQVNNAPVLMAIGPQTTNEYFVTDTASQIRSQSIQVKLDSSGNLLNDAGNSFSMYGSVTIGNQTFSGLLLQGTPTAFGFDPHPGSLPHYDMNVTLTGGSLKTLYGPDAYVSIITETNNTFTGSFAQTFQASKPITNVRAYNAPSPLPVPEPSTLVVILAFGGAGWMYRNRRCFTVADLSVEE